MNKSIGWTLLVFAGSLAIAGCQTSASNEGAGFESLKPSAETSNYIILNDVSFARQVASHNRTCAAMPACRK